uniref:Arm-DNA-bind_5 domain-containing protein n=1 Tax=Heterorhabditis bacteriophora TaxID=37862 RepID=A0A1I7X751_HETBA
MSNAVFIIKLFHFRPNNGYRGYTLYVVAHSRPDIGKSLDTKLIQRRLYESEAEKHSEKLLNKCSLGRQPPIFVTAMLFDYYIVL